MTLQDFFAALVVLLGLCDQSFAGKYTVATFHGNERELLNHLTVNTESQELYVGAVNAIYRLSENLTHLEFVKTGQEMDNPNCPVPVPSLQEECSFERKKTDTYSKALVIDYTNRRLIACSNLYHGICEKRHLDNITAKDQVSYVPVVANNATASTVAFIAKGPAEESGQPQPMVLYVGATWTNTGLSVYRDKVPAFCSRNLDDFKLVRGGFRPTKMEIESQQRATFSVKYVFGFGSGKFSYMVTVQKQSAQTERYISKLIRVCQNDKEFYSYAEVELRCTHQGTTYNLVQAAHLAKAGKNLAQSLGIPTTEDVLYAVFSIGQANSPNPVPNSTFCIYPLRVIRKKFTENTQNCFKGNGNTGPDHIMAPGLCSKAGFTINDDYCGDYDINTPIDGTYPVERTAVLQFPSNTSVSSIIVSITYDYTVAFVGTTKGHIIKVSVEGATMAKKYEDVTVEEGSYINTDLCLDDEEKHLYVMTERKLIKLKVQDCGQYKTCGECLGAKDPYCGWCSLENKCSLRDKCKAYEMSMRWLPYSGQQCTNITKVIPDKIQKDHSRTHLLRLSIQNLPTFSGRYECAFSYTASFASIITPANRTSDGVKCMTPLPNQLPPFPTGQDHIVMRLSVAMNDQDFVSTDFIFFDCLLHNSCTSCTQSNFPCTWCVRNHMCSHNADEDCRRSDTLVTGQARVGPTDRPGPRSCPRFELLNQNTHILVPAGTSKEISVRGINLQQFQTDKSSLKCIFNLNAGRVVNADIVRFSDYVDIKCRSVDFTYIHNISYQNVPFQIVWGDNKPLDNPSNIQVMMYKCNAMATSCGSCLAQPDKFLCGWCENQCSTQQNCHRNNKDWLPNTETCRNPSITRFSPLSGPRAGGTLLTIEGENLGKVKEDLIVEIDGIACEIQTYDPPTKIVCETGPAKYLNQDGNVKVIIKQTYRAISKKKFTYVIPKIDEISPTKGPFAGGTYLTIMGEHMDAGTKKNVTIGNVDCRFIPNMQPNAKKIVCETARIDNMERRPYSVRLNLDKEVIHAPSSVHFTYVENPEVDSIRPKKAIRSGGLTITAFGNFFDHVQSPRMVLLYKDDEFTSSCTLQTSKKMICSSPLVNTLDKHFVSPVEVSYGFQMDNVENIYNLSANEDRYGMFTLYPDPVFDEFKGKVKSHQKKTEFLTINGRNLNPAIKLEDVKVLIGRGFCNVTSIAAIQLTCRPPKSQPSAMEGTGPPEVVVHVGTNLTFGIGYLQYEEPEMLTLTAIIGIAAGAGFLVLIVIIVIIAYQVKSRRSDDMMKKMRIQMDTLEARVANECKEAFAELQTDMTELTSDLYGQVSIPFWDYRTYCMKVLFPGVENHAVTKDLQYDYRQGRDDIERGLQQFFQLMGNKTFLLIFIRTLESSKNFQLRDRVNVASLISVALQTKMEYSTDILKTLLADLIEKSVEGKNHPKLLLRRNESVAEKMLTNWFTFLLYKFLKECAGEPLFMLYQAIKQQVSKGPVDAVTSEARYSLGEDKLIRQQINYKPMTLSVMDMDSFTREKQTHTVKVLDCDTISQVKEKILDAMYKNAPFSSRPAMEELDLVLFGHPPEWISSEKSRQLILHDEDTSSKMDGECKRMNTLNHYQVPDGAFVAIVPKQDSPYNMSIISEKSSNFKYENLSYSNRSPPLSRVVTPQMISVDMDNNGIKFYHLVRQHDADVQTEGDRGSKMVTEIYLPRLLVTKGTLQQFVDDLFERIFSTAHRGTALPLAIKYMFDFLDDQALLHNIQDPEVVHTWKSNSLPLRFWVNVIKNPNFVFDIYKSNIVDSCLTVVGQTFMDTCSVSEHRLGKDSPSSKLLYAKDIPKYKQWVERYYQDIKMMPAISDQDMTAMLTEESRLHQEEFNTNAALLELYKYVQKYNEDLVQALEEDEFARKSRLSLKLDQVLEAMEGDAIC